MKRRKTRRRRRKTKWRRRRRRRRRRLINFKVRSTLAALLFKKKTRNKTIII